MKRALAVALVLMFVSGEADAFSFWHWITPFPWAVNANGGR